MPLDTALCFTGRCGLVMPWGKGEEGPPLTVADRFFAGGIGSMRGFRNKVCGLPLSQESLGVFDGSGVSYVDLD